MEKKNTTVDGLRALYAQREKAMADMDAVMDGAQAREEGQRELTDEEQARIVMLRREVDTIDARLDIATRRMRMPEAGGKQGDELVRMVREAVSERRVLEVRLDHPMKQRSAGTQNLSSLEPLVPLTVNDVIQPLEEGLIYDKVGVTLQTGLAGNYVWPVVGTIEATLAGEAVELDDSMIDITKVTPVMQRIGVTVPVTAQAITQSEGRILDIVNRQLPLAMTRVINRAMFCPEEYDSNFTGPFSDAQVNTVTFAGAVPTYAELLQMKGTVLKTGFTATGTMAYVMDEYMKATLEATPRDAGSGLMVIEDGKIAGVPVFCTNFINYKANGSADTSHVAFGLWGYEVLGQFGDFRFIVDPYSRAKEDIIQFTLNADWSMTALDGRAFVLGTVTETTSDVNDN